MWNYVEPNQVQVTPTGDNKWSWAICYGSGSNASNGRDINGTEETLSLALLAVQNCLSASLTRAFAYD